MTRWALLAVRVGLPGLLAAVGVVLVVRGGDAAAGAGVALMGSAVIVVLANLYVRLGAADERERERESAARDFLAEHGHWPDEPPPARPPASRAGPSGAPSRPAEGRAGAERGRREADEHERHEERRERTERPLDARRRELTARRRRDRGHPRRLDDGE
jgi:hypothetical protein